MHEDIKRAAAMLYISQDPRNADIARNMFRRVFEEEIKTLFTAESFTDVEKDLVFDAYLNAIVSKFYPSGVAKLEI